VLFSAAYKDNSPLRQLWALENVELITSAYAADEARRNLASARPARLDELEKLISALTIVGEAPADLKLPDGIDLPVKDQPVFLAALAAQASHLLTGDKVHFGTYYGQTVAGIQILRPADYLLQRKASQTT